MKVKSIENYYMILNDFAYDPFTKNGVKYIRVTYVPDTRFTAVHLYDNLMLISSNMEAMLNIYINDLTRNRNLIGDDF